MTAKSETGARAPLPSLSVGQSWWDIFAGRTRWQFEAILPDFLQSQPWFSSEAKTIKLALVREFFRVPLPEGEAAALAILQIEYVNANPELCALPLAFATGDEAGR